MKVKTTCEQCGAEDVRDREGQSYCPECGRRTWHNARYFPEADDNKVFAVDVWLTVSHCMKVEAKDADEAEVKAREALLVKLQGCTQAEEMGVLRDMGFEGCDEVEYKTSGEADEHGEIQYY